MNLAMMKNERGVVETAKRCFAHPRTVREWIADESHLSWNDDADFGIPDYPIPSDRMVGDSHMPFPITMERWDR